MKKVYIADCFIYEYLKMSSSYRKIAIFLSIFNNFGRELFKMKTKFVSVIRNCND